MRGAVAVAAAVAGLDAAAVEDGDFGAAADPVVRDLVVRVVPAVRLNVHRVLQDG